MDFIVPNFDKICERYCWVDGEVHLLSYTRVPGIESRWERYLLHPCRPAPRPSQPPVNTYRVPFPAVKRPPLALGLKTGYSYTSTFPLGLHALFRVKFTCTVFAKNADNEGNTGNCSSPYRIILSTKPIREFLLFFVCVGLHCTSPAEYSTGPVFSNAASNIHEAHSKIHIIHFIREINVEASVHKKAKIDFPLSSIVIVENTYRHVEYLTKDPKVNKLPTYLRLYIHTFIRFEQTCVHLE